MLLLISMVVFMTIFLIVYMLLATYVPTRGQVAMRLKALDSMVIDNAGMDEELSKPFAQRIISPLTGNLATSLMRFTPQATRRRVEEKLLMAGGFGGLTADGFLLLCVFLAGAFPLAVGSLILLFGGKANTAVGLAMMSVTFGALLPFLMLRGKIATRKTNIQKDLPDVLDLLTVSVEAGLGFDGALNKLTEKMKGALVEEFNRVLQEIRVGIPRRDALHSLGVRCDVADLALFTTALVQADQLGVSIGNVLRVQSAAMREKRRQRAQEKAMKAPVKMLLPLVIFIFPTLFIVLLGPAVINIMASFGGK